ncbi:unnamed protein product [Musa acuminata var. zebrina]
MEQKRWLHGDLLDGKFQAHIPLTSSHANTAGACRKPNQGGSHDRRAAMSIHPSRCHDPIRPTETEAQERMSSVVR